VRCEVVRSQYHACLQKTHHINFTYCSSSSVALQSLKGPWPPHTRDVYHHHHHFWHASPLLAIAFLRSLTQFSRFSATAFQLCPLKVRMSMSILSAHLLQGLTLVLFPSGFAIKTSFAGCWSFIRIKCPAHFSCPTFICVIILVYISPQKSYSSWLYRIRHSLPSLTGP
jgi:hypothetical protein